MGLVDFREPFARLFNQGMIYRHGAKMAKSKGNVVPPEEMISRYGADATRLYILFMAPADEDKEWQDTGIEGTSRFLARLWRLAHEVAERGDAGAPGDGPLVRSTHATIERVTDDIERRFQFNTPVAALMELLNQAHHAKDDPDQAAAVRLRHGDDRLARPAVRAARRGGALGASGSRAALGGDLAGAGSGDART